jgi:hypothetical protein
MQRAFAAGLQAQGWRVDLTTASRHTPTTCLHDMIVLEPKPITGIRHGIIHYLDRVSDLGRKPVVVIVSGGGMTERAMRILQSRHQGRGTIRDAIEIWTSRPNEDVTD